MTEGCNFGRARSPKQHQEIRGERVVQGIVHSVGDQTDRLCTAKVIDEGKRIENIQPLDALAGMGGKPELIFAAASRCVHMIFDAANEHFRTMDRMVNVKPRMVSTVAAETFSCQRIWRLSSIARLGPSIGP